MTSCTMDDYLGAYVLHALQDHEEAAVRSHLSGCDRCSAEVESLAGTAACLALLSWNDVEQALAPVIAGGPRPTRTAPRPVGTVESRGGRRPARPGGGRRSGIRRGVLAVASAVVVAGTAGGVAGGGATPSGQEHPHPGGFAVTRVVERAPGVSAALTVARRDSATALHLSLRGGYPDGTCSLIVRARDGRSETAATWVAGAEGTAEVHATTTLALDDLADVDVVTGTGHELIRFGLSAHG